MSCGWGPWGTNGHFARCDGGAGQFRAKGKCSGTLKYGPWKGIGSNSYIICPSGTSMTPGTSSIELLPD